MEIVSNMMKPITSIIIPAYNCERWIGETIDSALAQTWPNKEIIIVDDGSTDGTLSIAKRYESKIVKVVRRENGGASRARNFGLKLAQGDYIQWLDSDDLLDKDKIKKQMDAIKIYGPEVLAVGKFGAFYYRTEKAIFKKTGLWRDLSPVEWLIIRFSECAWMQAASWLLSRKLSDIAGYWDERLCLDEDGEYFSRLVSRSKYVKFVESAISYYRRGILGSLCMNRSNRALESLLLSMELSFHHLRSMEDTERTKDACLKYLQRSVLDYFPGNPDMADKAATLAQKIGGVLIKPDVGWKLRAAERVLGWEKALLLRGIASRMKISVIKSVDKFIYDFNRQKKSIR